MQLIWRHLAKVTTLILFISFSVSAKSINDFKGPREVMGKYLEMMVAVKKGDESQIDQASKFFDLKHVGSQTRDEVAKLTAERLINTLDRLERIDINTIPKDFISGTWIYRKQNVLVNNKVHPVEISIAKVKDLGWVFTKETVRSVEFFEQSLQGSKVVAGVTELITWKTKVKKSLPSWTGDTIVLLKNGQWLSLFGLVIFAFILMMFNRHIVLSFIKSQFERHNLVFNEKKHHYFFTSLEFIVFFLTIFVFVRPLELPANVLSIVFRCCYIGLAISGAWAGMLTVDILSIYFMKIADRTENKFDDILIPLLSRACKVLIGAIGIVFIGHALTINVTNIVAGLGIGGLAIAFAAKDTLSNFFGSLTVILDRPFQIGDWVCLGNGVEGIIESVGFRSTRVRTFYDSLISVPNNQLINIHIDNYGKRKYRRLNTKIDIQYDTPPEKIEAFCEGIRQIIARHPYTRKDYFHVYLNEMGASSLKLILYVFWEVNDWSEELNEKHRLYMDIIRLGRELGVEFAFPTQTLHLFNETKSEDVDDIGPDYFKQAHEMGTKLTEKTLTPKAPRSQAPDLEKDPLL